MGYLNTFLIKRADGFAPVEIVDNVPTDNMRNVTSRVRPAGGSMPPTPPTTAGIPSTPAPASNAIVPYKAPTVVPSAPAPASHAIVPYQAPAKPAPTNKSINYGRRFYNSARIAGRNAWRAGRQGSQALWQLAKRNPKMAALLAGAGVLGGGALMAGAANSGRPPVRQSNATNPYAGLETYA